MKNLIILYNQPLNSKQGINTVNNSFFEGRRYFEENGIKLFAIIGVDGIVYCDNRFSLMELNGDAVTEKGHNIIKTKIRHYLPKNSAIIDAVKIYNSCYRTADITFNRFIQSGIDPDYIIFQDPQTAELYFKKFGNKRKARTIMILHCSISATEQAETTWPSFFKSKFLSNYFYSTYRAAISGVDKLVYLSPRAADSSPVPSEKKVYIFNGEEDLREHEFTAPHTPINITCVGSMAWHKGQDYVVEAMSKLPIEILASYQFHLIGSGPQMQEIKDSVKRFHLEDHVTFYGNRSDVPDLLKQMDLFIMPSISEGLPMSIIEALRQGMYVIGTDTGAIPEMIAPGCGMLVERDVNKIADALTKVVQDNCITLEMKRKAREHYLKYFTLKSMVYNYCKVLQSL